MNIRRRHIVAFSLSSLLASSFAFAQSDYPNRPITLIVPYAAGGTVDVFARLVAPELQRRLGKTVIVENVNGAGGMIGISRAVRASPDGYTITMGIVSDVVLAPLTEKAATYTFRDLAPIAPIGTSGVGVVANSSLGISSFSQLISYAKKNPGKLSYGATGKGSLPAIAMESLKNRTQIDIAYIPYASASKIALDAMGGHVDIAVSGLPALLEHVRAGKLTAVGVMSKGRDIGAPNIAAASETPELAGMDFYFWTGIFAPKSVPAPIISKLNTAITEAMQEKNVQTRFTEMGLKISKPMQPAEFATFVAESNRSWEDILKQNKFVKE